jgi:uncharacterized membrane protein YphA (DoxX/SURF4 family)
MAYPGETPALDLPAWKTVISASAALILALLFASAGIWKITDPIEWAAKVNQLKVPGALAQPFTILLGVGELFAAVLLVVPRFRRWGAWLTGLMLIGFMLWVGYFYNDLTGKDCSCFPWLKRAIGPGFFAGDALMVLLAAGAGFWARRSHGLRPALIMLAAISVFAGASYGIAASRTSGTMAPESITVDGQPFSLREGRVFVYFFDPECSHCLAAAKAMSTYRWKDVRVVVLPTRVPQFAGSFLDMAGFKAPVSLEADKLKAVFPFGDPPYGVALELGRQKAALNIFDEREPAATLRQIGFIE